MVSSTEYEKVTFKQIDDMKHALGFDNRKVTGTKHRKYEPYRNYFCAGGNDIDDWKILVGLGFSEEGKDNYFRVTADGRDFLERVMGIKFLEEIK